MECNLHIHSNSYAFRYCTFLFHLDSSSHSQRQGTDTASGSDFPLPERVSVGCLVQVSEMETDVLESLQSHLGSSLAEVTDVRMKMISVEHEFLCVCVFFPGFTYPSLVVVISTGLYEVYYLWAIDSTQ